MRLIMKSSQDDKNIILFLLFKNSIVQFIAGILSLLVIIKLSTTISFSPIKLLFKSFGYGFFCYLTTPFMIYWLSYVSQGQATDRKLIITVALMGLYSYCIWDAYFFFREAFSSWVSVNT